MRCKMPKVTTKIRWQRSEPCVTLRVSGTWNEVIMALHEAAMKIKEDAMARGHVGLSRERAGVEVLEAVREKA